MTYCSYLCAHRSHRPCSACFLFAFLLALCTLHMLLDRCSGLATFFPAFFCYTLSCTALGAQKLWYYGTPYDDTCGHFLSSFFLFVFCFLFISTNSHLLFSLNYYTVVQNEYECGTKF
ncbi:hypothetical protein QOT17_011490 [Balamuthia mandrillaris]